VNRHGGGAALLEEPELLFAIVSAVRRSVPAHMPVSAKMRLGFNDDSRAVECALAIEAGGVNELVVHARTKADAYRPPAYWERIADIRAAVCVPVVANGEIWNVQDALRCQELSGSHMLMLGRGMVTDPGLARAIQAAWAKPESNHDGADSTSLTWDELLPLIADFWTLVCAQLERRQQAGRLKQWLNFLRRRYPQAELAYMALRTVNDPTVIDQWLSINGLPGFSLSH
jgi:tRNA-dihydrouridine synthase C